MLSYIIAIFTSNQFDMVVGMYHIQVNANADFISYLSIASHYTKTFANVPHHSPSFPTRGISHFERSFLFVKLHFSTVVFPIVIQRSLPNHLTPLGDN